MKTGYMMKTIAAEKILLFASIAIIVLICGCDTGNATKSPGKDGPIDTPAGMIAYLKGLNLPALKSVDLWQNDYGPGLKLTTSHYEIFTTLLEPLMLSQVPGFVESAYRAYQKQLPSPVQTTSKFTIYLFADRRQWNTFTIHFVGSQAPIYMKIKKGAYTLKGACVAYNIGIERTFSVIGHEGWHQFSRKHFSFRLPSWLDEGIAMLFEAHAYDRGFFYFEPAKNFNRLATLRKTLQENKIIPLRRLVSMNPGEAILESDDAVGAFYSQSYALVRFLREDDYGRWLPNYHRLMQDGLEGKWPLSDTGRRIAADRNVPMTVRLNRAFGLGLFKKYVGNDFEDIERQYIRFCRKIVYHVRLTK